MYAVFFWIKKTDSKILIPACIFIAVPTFVQLILKLKSSSEFVLYPSYSLYFHDFENLAASEIIEPNDF